MSLSLKRKIHTHINKTACATSFNVIIVILKVGSACVVRDTDLFQPLWLLEQPSVRPEEGSREVGGEERGAGLLSAPLSWKGFTLLSGTESVQSRFAAQEERG